MSISLIAAILIIGFSAGLRSLTAPAVVAWAAYLERIHLGTTGFSFVSSPITVGVLSLLALGEYVADLLPGTPNRTAAVGLTARVITGTFCAACLCAAAGSSLVLALLGGAAAIAGAFAGLYVRSNLTTKLNLKDAFIAIPEDLVAIALACIAVSLV